MVEILLVAVAPIEDTITPTLFPKPIFCFLEAILLHSSTFGRQLLTLNPFAPTFFLLFLTKIEAQRT